jgi:CubicO group peptidase (beta-lactamase class C family)
VFQETFSMTSHDTSPLRRMGSTFCILWLACTASQAQGLPPSLFLPELLLARQSIEVAPKPQALSTVAPKAPISGFRYTYQGATKSLGDFQTEAKVRAMLVLKDGKIVYEYNKFPYGKSSLHQSWSVGKQVLSAMIGVAIDEGAIRSVDDRMDTYAPELAINGFAGVTFKQALQMSSGIAYNEEADRFKLFLDTITDRFSNGSSGFSLIEKTLDSKLTQAYTPGSKFEYASINSQALSLALEKAVGMPYAQYLERKLWKPMGTTDRAKILVDRSGESFTFCCLYATTRSYAMFGLMYAQGGRLHNQQIVSSSWVKKSTTFQGDPSHWRAVPRAGGELGLYGFGYHWWPLAGDRGDFSALGIFGQAIHVLPAQNTVIVRISADFDTPGAHAEENAIMGRALADYLD